MFPTLTRTRNYLFLFCLSLPETPLSPRGSNSYWTPLPDTESPGKYCDFFANFLIATIRSHEGHPSGYDIPLTRKQARALNAFLTVLRADGDLLPHLQEFLECLCEQQPEPTLPGTWTCPVQCFWAARALRSDDNFVQPDHFTQWLTKTKHLCIITTALNAIKHAADFPNGLIG